MGEILVIGSSNIDMVVRTTHIPAPGETVIGDHFFQNCGGKGANQAVCCAKLGAATTMITKVGSDAFGSHIRENLTHAGVNDKNISTDKAYPSGVALITISEDAENSIVVAPGANAHLSIKDIEGSKAAFESAEVVLLQLEIPMDTVVYAAKLANSLGKKVILNPAPSAEIPGSLLLSLYAITPNQIEAQQLTGIKVNDEFGAKKAAMVLESKGVKVVIITMGSQGAFLWDNGQGHMIAGYPIEAKDTTGAGDAFNGAFAVALIRKLPIEAAIIFANKTAALTASNFGAQPAMPTLEQVESFENRASL